MSVETFLTSGPLSLDEVISAIRTQSLDDSERPVFSDAEIKVALRQAIVNSYGKFFTSDTYTVTFVGGTYSYTLPSYVQRITLITRASSGLEASGTNTLTGTSSGKEMYYYRHLKNISSNTLYFMRDYPASTLTIWYDRDVVIPIDNRELGSAADSDDTTFTLSDADPQLYRVSTPTYFKIDNEIVLVTATSANTTLTVSRGKLGTTAAAHSAGASLSQMVYSDSDRFYNFLFQETGRLLNEFRVQAGNQSVSVSANITAARMFKENRETILKEIPQTKKPRRMKFTRGRRPRRGLY